jgi:hypothetical protein
MRNIRCGALAGLSLLVATPLFPQNSVSQPNNAKAPPQPPEFQGLMVDAKGKTVGRLFIAFGNSPSFIGIPTALGIVRQISGIWIALGIADFTTGFQTQDPTEFQKYYQSMDCTGQAYLPVSRSSLGGTFSGGTGVVGPAAGLVFTFPPATAPSIYFAGMPASAVNIQSRLYGGVCLSDPEPIYAGPIQSVPVSSLGLTLPFSIK